MISEKESKKILEKAPSSPGIYKMINEEGIVLYVGKAKDIKKRLRQYFQKDYQHSTRTKKLLENTAKIDFTSVDTELEAIIFESNLIKQLQPKYNILMKDDKNYVYIKITNEDFPRIQIVRKVEKDGAKYIGPKTAAHKVETTFKILKTIFPFRHCNLDIKFKKKLEIDNEVEVGNKVIKYPCLDYYIKTCAAPCIGKITKEEYAEIIKNVENFLSGKADPIVKDMKEKMQKLAANREFEKAGKLRDKLKKVGEILEKQKVSDPNQEDKDVINYYITQNKAYFNLFQIRDGKLIGQENFTLSAEAAEENESTEILEAFIKQYYKIATDIPKEILISHEIEDKNEIEKILSEEKKSKVEIVVPKIGNKNKLLEMSLNNAKIYADRQKPSWKVESEFTKEGTQELQKLLKLETPLKRIECYDISHLGGTETVGSMVVFQNGIPKNNLYRKFKLRTIEGHPDDYKSMQEVLTRRFSKITADYKAKDYIFKKATKKYEKEINKNIKKNNLTEGIDLKNFYTLEKNKKTLAAFAALQEHGNSVAQINSFFVMPKERGNKIGRKLLKNIIEKTKSKRIYIICKNSLLDYYAMIGFEEIKKVPQELEKTFNSCKACEKNTLAMAYDKNKHKPDESFLQIPDLIIIDGGKGQLSVATKVMQELELKIPHISLAKQLEEIFTPENKTSIILDKTNAALKLLQRIRDEAHRFAITYNKERRTKRMFK
ncbi:MAG: excinuclease ABC subunit UvrC [Candidatus Peregrinibacteria bacterium]|nr:excinuclease ABC subunit UvrC [Candidatus Peregrinibacteria bacterium]